MNLQLGDDWFLAMISPITGLRFDLQIEIIGKTDEDLMILVNWNDSFAFEELYCRYSKILLHFFYQMLGGDELQSQDFLHDVFLKIIEKPYLFNQSKNFKTWIFQISYNKCKNEYRRREIRNNASKKYEIKSNMKSVSEIKDSAEETIDKKHLNKLKK